MSKEKRTIFLENPYDLETLFETIEIAGREGKELLLVDRLISTLRLDPELDLTNLNYRLLRDFNLLTFEHEETEI